MYTLITFNAANEHSLDKIVATSTETITDLLEVWNNVVEVFNKTSVQMQFLFLGQETLQCYQELYGKLKFEKHVYTFHHERTPPYKILGMFIHFCIGLYYHYVKEALWNRRAWPC